MRIMAGQARDGLAGAKAAACQKPDRSESHGHGIFQFWFLSHSRHGKPVTPAADFDLSAGGKTSGIDQFFSDLFFRYAALRCLYVGTSGSVTTLTLNAGLQSS